MAPDEGWARLHAPDVTAAELAQIASEHPALRPYVAAHPLAYPELLAWLAAWHDPATDAALAARQAPAPVAPPPSPAPTRPAAGAPAAPAPRRRLGAGAVAGIVAGALVVVGGVTAGAIALTHRGGGSSQAATAMADMRDEPDELWTWQPDDDSAEIVDMAPVGDQSLAVEWDPREEGQDDRLVVVSLADGGERWGAGLSTCTVESSDGGGFSIPDRGVAADESTVAVFQQDCPGDGVSSVRLYDASSGNELSSAEVDGQLADAVVVDGTFVALLADENGGSRVAAWPVDAVAGDPSWERGVDDGDARLLCTVGPSVVGVAEYLATDESSACGPYDSLVDLVDLSDDGRSPLDLGSDDTQVGVRPVDGFGYLVSWSDQWSLVDASGAEVRSGDQTEDEGMAAVAGVLFRFADGGYTLMRVDPRTGDDLWDDELSPDDSSWYLAGLSSKYLVIGDTSGTMTWYDAATGQSLFDASENDASSCRVDFGTSVAYLSGSGCVSQDGDGLEAFDTTDGSRLWSYDPGSRADIWRLGGHFFAVDSIDQVPTVSLLGAK